MATARDGRPPYESDGAGEKFRKRLFRPEIYEEPQSISQDARQDNSTGASELSTQEGGDFGSNTFTVGKSELEKMLKHMTFTRSETQRLIALLHSRTIKEPPTPLLGLEASLTSGSLKRHKHGDERDNFHASVVISRVLEEENASPAELAKANKGSSSSSGQASRQDLKLINNNATCLSKASVDHRPEDYGTHIVMEYVDSLVWVKPAKHEMADDA
ncbi:hypothetical protein L2E82_02720 [Cichorium intybus]|uniref:Uncharacterized protein n=1 Tax=Cichorium intybus TaxID=13427 RepID=A0ACB9H2E9_CICIN|nr:hypothetical protein L2E82_02720 [Cichorium intybus]